MLQIIICKSTRGKSCLTVATHVVFKKALKAPGSLQVSVDLAEVIIGDSIVLWIPHHIDHLIQRQ